MSDKGKFRESRQAVEKGGHLRVHRQSTRHGDYWAGDYLHKAGIVSILQEPPSSGWPKGYTRFDAVVDGRLVVRTWDRFWGKRTLPGLARQLLEIE